MKAPIQSRCFGISSSYLSLAEGDWGLGIGDPLWLICVLEQPQPLQPNYLKKSNSIIHHKGWLVNTSGAML
jgi:hypothetical protein